MNQKAEIFNNGILAGELERTKEGRFRFVYSDSYFQNQAYPAISLSFPKSEKRFQADALFPFFFGLLSEGVNKKTQCRLLKIDEKDHFGLLLKTATSDTIGAITIKEIVS